MGTLWASPAPVPTVPPPATRTLAQFFRQLTKPIAPSEPPEDPVPPLALDSARILQEEGVSRPADIINVLLDLYLPGGVRPEVRSRLVAFVAEGNPAGPALARRVREAVHAIMAMAEYQLA